VSPALTRYGSLIGPVDAMSYNGDFLGTRFIPDCYAALGHAAHELHVRVR